MTQPGLLSDTAAIPPARGADTFLGLAAWEFRLLVAVVTTANALLPLMIETTTRDGWEHALTNTFEISVIVWVSLAVVFRLLTEATSTPLAMVDKVGGLFVLALCLLPLGIFAWCVVTLTAFGLIHRSTASDTPLGRAGWLLLAVTVPTFWSKRLFALFADYLLAMDAFLVSSITGTVRTGNLVALPNGQGMLEIFAKCSSVANVSVALLCWVLFMKYRNVRRQPVDLLWCVAACVSVVFVNTCRIALIGFFPEHYDALHGPWGNTIAAWLGVFAVVGICHIGVQRGRIASA